MNLKLQLNKELKKFKSKGIEITAAHYWCFSEYDMTLKEVNINDKTFDLKLLFNICSEKELFIESDSENFTISVKDIFEVYIKYKKLFIEYEKESLKYSEEKFKDTIIFVSRKNSSFLRLEYIQR